MGTGQDEEGSSGIDAFKSQDVSGLSPAQDSKVGVLQSRVECGVSSIGGSSDGGMDTKEDDDYTGSGHDYEGKVGHN
jgi:hypothetical protein